MPTTGQFFFGTQGGLADGRFVSTNSDGSTQTVIADNTPTTDLVTSNLADVGLDTAAGFYFAIANGGDGSGAYLIRGSLSGGPATILVDYRLNVADPFDDTLVNGLVVDPVNNRIYVGMQEASGSVPGSSGIRQYSYNPLTGAVTDLGFLTTALSSGKPTEGGFNIFDPIDFDFNASNGRLFFTETLSGGAQAVGLFRLDLAAPNTIVQVVSQAQFPDNGSAGYIRDVEVDSSTGLLYFSTYSQRPSPDPAYNASQNAIWYISQNANGGTAVKVTLVGLPGGAFFYPEDMVFDQSTRQLYVESESTDNGNGVSNDVIYVFQLDAVGTTATLVRTITPSPALTADSVNIQGMAFNVIPVLSALLANGTAALEQSANISLLTGAPTITDIDGSRLSSATVQVTGGTFNSNENSINDDNLAVGAGLQVSGLVAGTNITVSFNRPTSTLTLTGYDTLANYQAVLNTVRYFATGDNPTNYGANTTRTLTWTVNDGAVGLSAGSPNSRTTTVNITAVNDAPTSTGLQGDSVTTTETAGTGSTVPTVKIDVGGNATIADADNLNFNGGLLRFSFISGLVATEDQLNFDTSAATTVTTSGANILVGGTIVGTFIGGGAGGGLLEVSLNGNATPALVQTLIRAVNYTNTGGDNPTAGTRTIFVLLNDGSGTANGGTSTVGASMTVTVVAVDDAAVAVADSNTVAENGTIVGASVLGNDSDVDGPALSVGAVNGVAGNVGTQIALASGALVTLRANGTYDYNPNGAFNYLIDAATAAATGASNTSAPDSFTYTLTGGGTTTVTVTVNGVASAGDELRGTPGVDFINGTAGNDIISLFDSDDRARGFGGNDTIFGGLGFDQIGGGDGDDTLDGGTGVANELGGGPGNDTYVARALGDTITESLGEGTDLVQSYVNVLTLSANVENLTFLGAGNFVGVGNGLDNVITGGVGADSLSGGGGNDTLIGGSGAANELQGGAGDDIFVVSVAGDSIVETVGGGTDTVQTALGAYVLPTNVENLTYTGAGSFNGTGNALDNTITHTTGTAGELTGLGGNDTYVVTVAGDTIIEAAAGGTDTVQTTLTNYTLANNVENLTFTGGGVHNGVGNGGDNVITGGTLADALSGLNGNDTLIGGNGADLLIGGAGNDIFRYLGGETGLDRILDFTSGSDKISLNAAFYSVTGTLAFVSGTSPFATTANSTFLYDSNTGILSYDADGNGAGAAVQIAQLNSGLPLSLGDFVIV